MSAAQHTNVGKKGVRLALAGLIMLSALALLPINASAAWWNGTWGYRVRLDIGANGYARFDRPVERAINFTTLFSNVGASGPLTEASIRVIEVDGSGNVLDSAVVFQFDKDTDYNATTKASGTLVFMMKGTTASGATRHFDVYFDNRAGFFAPLFTSAVGVSTVSDWEGQESFKITSTRATYYFHKLGGGFASAIDVDGNDWISYHPPSTGYFGEWRGIPNLGSCGHPGYTNSTSSVASSGPLKVTLMSERNDGKQRWYTAIYPHNVTITVARSDSNYWFLYEGTPGGALVGATQYMYTSDGTQTQLDNDWSTDLPGDEWAYFNDPATNRSLYMVHHEQDNLPESYRNGGGDGMTVFGFGREQTTDDWLLTAVPQTLSFGIMDGTNFSASSDTIHAIYKAMSISQGAAEKGIPNPPAAPVLLSPANNATGVTVPAALRWNVSSSATAYRLQVAVDAGFASRVYDDSTLTDTTASVGTLGSKTTYYWRVAGKNAAGFGAFATARQFQTVLGTPAQVSPSNGATGQAVPVTLRWNTVANATSYGVQVATSNTFSTGVVLDDGAVTDTVRVVTGLAATTQYYWRVKAKDASSEGAYTAARSFTTSVAAPAPKSPANHATDVPLSTTIAWHAVPLAVTYHLQIATDAGFGSGVVLDDATITDSSRVVAGLVKSSTYYWRVSAVSAGGEGPFSSTSDFTTFLPPPVQVYPGNNTVAIPLSPTFVWNKVAGATHYWFQLASDSNFTTLLKNDTSIVDTQRTVANLTSAARYYWRVSVKTASATSPFSSRWTFRAMSPVPETVVLVKPLTFAQVAPDSIRLYWRKTATAATMYWVDIALDANFSVMMTDSTADTSRVYTGLLVDHGYWWRVRGGNGEAWGPFSETRQFTVKTTGTAVADQNEIPREFGLKQNYPNPFNPSTTVSFAVAHEGPVRLEVYNMLGGLVATLADGVFPAGNFTLRVDASQWSSGTYFYRMTAGGQTFVRRMMLLK